MTPRALSLTLALAALALLLAACLFGSVPLPAGRMLAALAGGGEAGDRVIVWTIRLPRAVAAFGVGALLGISGAALQGLLRNPLAEPGVLGVSASAALAATVTLALGAGAVGGWVVPVATLGGALAATTLIAAVAVATRSAVTLILVGVALSSFAGAVMALTMSLSTNPFTLADLVNWTLGSVANRGWPDLWLALPPAVLGCVILWLSRRGLSALTLGEEAAAGLGLDLAHQRVAVVIGAGLATGAAVAVAGAIGFVGIVAPHLVRGWVGHDPARSLLPSTLLGGLLLLAADILVRLLPGEGELHLSVVAALVGAPAFAWIAARRERS